MTRKKEVTTEVTSSSNQDKNRTYSVLEVLMFSIILLFMMSADSWINKSIESIIFCIGLGFILPIAVLYIEYNAKKLK